MNVTCSLIIKYANASDNANANASVLGSGFGFRPGAESKWNVGSVSNSQHWLKMKRFTFNASSN